MSAKNDGKVIVLMGVSGAGKSTIGKMLGKALSCDFLDADDFHSLSNRGNRIDILLTNLLGKFHVLTLIVQLDKMRQGIALSDEDRMPWLEKIQESLRKRLLDGETVVLACSSLRKQYREILRGSDPDYKPGSYTSCKVKFVLLEGNAEVIAARLQKRASEEEHFMPLTLLQSQFDLLQADECEKIFKISVVLSPEVIVNTILEMVANSLNP
ncbi:P-loop containing nucleoside triphosphate hydrolase [Arabidopsis thaliana x Arabidopsis arenosa]|uniref:P-loop containing nucleoside triphosphate hydrolase n=1 Tax=Arabidopsis thaliana x Arabidopsis arenosa TaxID=1240361 RepID=A0A8T2FLU0_9BRAS|nr:P-loop containing nucleoside triphosphate hydrolase [Arabidopsis thaliana x Arabidopsis arenosa]